MLDFESQKKPVFQVMNLNTRTNFDEEKVERGLGKVVLYSNGEIIKEEHNPNLITRTGSYDLNGANKRFKVDNGGWESLVVIDSFKARFCTASWGGGMHITYEVTPQANFSTPVYSLNGLEEELNISTQEELNDYLFRRNPEFYKKSQLDLRQFLLGSKGFEKLKRFYENNAESFSQYRFNQ